MKKVNYKWGLLLLLSIFILTSCKITKSLWQPYYTDKIHDFVTTKGGGQIAFLGQKYHYIFDDRNGVMKRLLFWTQHDLLYIDLKKTRLQLNGFNDISGYVEVKTASPNLRVKDVAYLERLGFVRERGTHWSGRVFVSGKRYAPKAGNYKLYSLGNEYTVKIYYPVGDENKLKQAGKILISPITITLDAILWLGNKVVYDD